MRPVAGTGPVTGPVTDPVTGPGPFAAMALELERQQDVEW